MRMSLHNRYCFFYFLFFYIHPIPAVEYVYPVASLGNGKPIVYIHQHSPDSIELREWNPTTNNSEQMLWSVFNPAGLQLLPDNSGFSFIDNGRLRVKLFQKRSPKAIDFDEPFFGINGLQWIDNHTCYCSAQYNNNFALFELHDDGTLQCLRAETGKHCMYPQKVGDQLFYIERCATKSAIGDIHYQIVSSSYQNNDLHCSQAELIVDFYNSPIIFLTMLSDTQGFVVEHAQSIDSENLIMPFAYHQIIKEGGVWHKKRLFSFSVPTCLLLDSEQRLYESLLPLLPRVIKNKVYFVDCSQNKNCILEPYFYELLTKKTNKIAVPTKKGHYFVPLQCGNRLYCGGTKSGKKEPFISFLT